MILDNAGCFHHSFFVIPSSVAQHLAVVDRLIIAEVVGVAIISSFMDTTMQIDCIARNGYVAST